MRNSLSSFIVVSLLLLVSCSAGDRNCDDIHAKNYHKRATTDEGCIFPETSQSPLLLTSLQKKVKETSGLAIIDDEIFTHNDQGNDNHLYVIDAQTGKVDKTIIVANTTNEDWEDLAMSNTHLFIGDMGNNRGDRQNLRVFSVAKSALRSAEDLSSVPIDGVIEFSYPEQTVFIDRNHNFDCEAILYHEGHLYLFTKHRADNRTNLYRLPAQTGVYDAQMIASFPAGGRVTGADISPSGKSVVICGYLKSSDVFLWEFTDFTGDNFFSGKKRKITLGPFSSIGQVEAVVFKNENTLYLSSEKVKEYNLDARLYRTQL